VEGIGASRATGPFACALHALVTLARRAQVKRVFALARPGLLEACNPELQALFRAVIYAFSIWVNKQTPGNMFMNLVFANSYAADTPRPPGCVRLNLFVCVRERESVCVCV
jgi:hypothetical protein